MPNYSIWSQATAGMPGVAADTNTTDLGTEFFVTTTTCTLTGYWWWLPAGGATASVTFRLWSVTTSTTGSLVSGSQVSSGTLTAGQWNFTALTPAVTLTQNQRYRASVTYTGAANHYGVTSAYFSSGGGASNIVNGSLTCPSGTNATGALQGTFNEPSTAGFPSSSFTSSNYWIDIQVTDSSGGNVTASAGLAAATGTALPVFFPPPPFTAVSDAIPGLARPGFATPGNPLKPATATSATPAAGLAAGTGTAPAVKAVLAAAPARALGAGAAPQPAGPVPVVFVDLTPVLGPTASRAQVLPGTAGSRAQVSAAGSVQDDGTAAGSVTDDGKQAGPTTVNRSP